MGEEKKPSVSIVMATYNRADLIGETLESIIKQTYKDWECIIVDDGSTDNVSDIIEPFIKQDNRIKYYNRSADHLKGCSGCRNFGVKLAKGDFVIFFDDDDIVHPANLSTCIRILRDTRKDFCRYQRGVFYDKFEETYPIQENLDYEEININNLEQVLKNELPFNSCQVMWKMECIKSNPFREEILYSDDWECYSRIISSGVKGVSINKTLYYARKHPASTTAKFQNRNKKILTSSRLATIYVIENLYLKNLMTPSLFKFLLQRGFWLRSYMVINFLLEQSNAGIFIKMKYRGGFFIYPVLRPFFRLKGKVLNS